MKLFKGCTVLFYLSLSLVFLSANAFEIHGHRGARSIYPENTLDGFHYAIEVGADFIEIDVHMSRDGEIIIHHDKSINEKNCSIPDEIAFKYSNNFSIRKMNSWDLAKVDCGLVNPNFPKQIPSSGAFIPTMKNLFEMIIQMRSLNANKVNINLEFKTKWWESDKYIRKMVNEALRVVDAYGFRHRTMIQSFDRDVVKYAKEVAPDIRNHYLSISGSKKLVENLVDWGLNGISVRSKRVTSRLVKSYHNAGLMVIPWTSNSPKEWDKLIRAGVDGIITDDPLGLAQFISRYYPHMDVMNYTKNQ